MKLFLDTEFTGLFKDTDLLSIGIVADNGVKFYAEFTDYREELVSDWVRKNVLSQMNLSEGCREVFRTFVDGKPFFNVTMKGNKESVKLFLGDWLKSFGETVEIWSDCLSYDWVLFCDIFGDAFSVPDCVYYIPFDICTVFRLKGVDPDISREGFAGFSDSGTHNIDTYLGKIQKHNALSDAYIIKACYEKLMEM